MAITPSRVSESAPYRRSLKKQLRKKRRRDGKRRLDEAPRHARVYLGNCIN